MAKKHIILWSLICVLWQGTYGQALGIGAPGLINFPDTGYSGYSINTALYVKNTGGSAFTGTVYIDYAVNSVVQTSSLYSGTLSNLLPGDSTLLPISNFYFYSSVYNVNAINVVVVWPRAAAPVTTSDSSEINVFVADSMYYSHFTQMPELSNGNAEVLLVPNPAYETLSVLNIKSENFQGIELIEPATGRVIRHFSTTHIALNDVSPGYYYLIITMKNAQRKYLSFLKP